MKFARSIIVLLLLSFNLSNPTLGIGASSSCASTACIYLPSVQHTGALWVANKGYFITRVPYFKSVWGEISGKIPAIDVTVESRFYDDPTQDLLTVHSATPVLTATLPGQLNPVAILTAVDTNTYPNTYDTLTVSAWQPMGGQEYLPITVVSVQITSHEDVSYSIIARVRNDTGKTLSHVRGVAWNGANIDVINYAPLLAPAETITMSYYLPGELIYSFTKEIKVSVQGIAQYP